MKITSVGNTPKPCSRLEFLQADAQEKYKLAYVECAGTMRRIGLEPGKIHIFKLNAAMDRAHLDRTARMALKTQLARLHLLDE